MNTDVTAFMRPVKRIYAAGDAPHLCDYAGMNESERKSRLINAIRTWLIDVMALRNWTAAEWARLADLAPSTIQRAQKDGYQFVTSANTLAQLAAAARVAAPDLRTDVFEVIEVAPSQTSLTPGPVDADPDKVRIRQLDLRFGMGGGGIDDNAEQVATPMSFSRGWIRQLTSSPIEGLFWASGMGDSMSPTIADGDILLIDTSQRNPLMRDQIWALSQYGQGMVKRLRRTEVGYAILSDNPQVGPDHAADGSMDVIGRVVAIVRKV